MVAKELYLQITTSTVGLIISGFGFYEIMSLQ